MAASATLGRRCQRRPRPLPTLLASKTLLAQLQHRVTSSGPGAVLRAVLWLLAMLGTTPLAHAHDPFDGNSEVVVTDQRITVTITLGYDAARAVLAAQQLPAETAAALARSGGRRQLSLPLAGAPQLVAIEAGGEPLAATSFLVAPDEVEFTFQIVYPRPGGATVLLRAGYFSATGFMRPGSVVVLNQQRRLITRLMVRSAAPTAEVPLALAPGAAGQANRGGMVQHFHPNAAASLVSAPAPQGPRSRVLVATGLLLAMIAALLLLRRRIRRRR